MNDKTHFCLNNYLPKNLISDMSLLDTSDSEDDLKSNNKNCQKNIFCKTYSPQMEDNMMNTKDRLTSPVPEMHNYLNRMSPFNANQFMNPRCKNLFILSILPKFC
jgi:hypothetical protein